MAFSKAILFKQCINGSSVTALCFKISPCAKVSIIKNQANCSLASFNCFALLPPIVLLADSSSDSALESSAPTENNPW